MAHIQARERRLAAFVLPAYKKAKGILDARTLQILAHNVPARRAIGDIAPCAHMDDESPWDDDRRATVLLNASYVSADGWGNPLQVNKPPAGGHYTQDAHVRRFVISRGNFTLVSFVAPHPVIFGDFR